MYVLGISGGWDPVCPTEDASASPRFFRSNPLLHDSAAVLLHNGEVVAGIEEERLNRIKHTNTFAVEAVRFCLRTAGITLPQVDRIAYYFKEEFLNELVTFLMLQHGRFAPPGGARGFLAGLLSETFNSDIQPERLAFVDHHQAHAASAFRVAPFPDALVVTLDGEGDGLSTTVSAGERGKLHRLAALPRQNSLGHLYLRITRQLGYRFFDEYKVMGLAPYGDPARFREAFNRVCTLHEEGKFQLHADKLQQLCASYPPRRRGEPFTQLHKDLAASLQEALERAVLHLLKHYRASTGLRNLCLAGGVAHNSTLAGKILRDGLFDGVFVQPAASDAGCALGAALSVSHESVAGTASKPLQHVYWGTEVGSPCEVLKGLMPWSGLVEIVPLTDPSEAGARLVAEGAVIGWSQGRSEFGPRALGNRSILADPRPGDNKDRINALVKQRESYRPFAPSVLEEYAAEFFEVPPGGSLGFMTTVLLVKESWRAALGAVTHIDGSARVQTVSRDTNPRFWHLIDAFRQRTGIPILLNTSFNHSVEPIVDSVEDAVVCLLTTGLTHLIVGDYLVTRRPEKPGMLDSCVVYLPTHVRISRTRQVNHAGQITEIHRCESDVDPTSARTIAPRTGDVLALADGHRRLADLLHDSADRASITAEIRDLWTHRLIGLRPC